MSFKSLELRPNQEFILEALEIGLSSNCNFKCDYCCAFNLNDRKFLSGEKVNQILDDAPDLRRVKLSGGEVLIYFDECVKVIEYCTRRGIETQINTNGSLLNHDKISALEEAGLGCLHFSYNFTVAERFSSYYRQSVEVFARIERNLMLAARSSIDTVAESVVFKSTEFSLIELHNRLFDLGVRKHEIQNGIPIAKSQWDEVLPIERVHEVIEDLVTHRKPEMQLYFSCMHIDHNSDFHRRVLRYLEEGNVHFPSCIEGRSQLHVHSNGEVLICELGHPEVIGNLNNGLRLATILRNRPSELDAFLERRSKFNCACAIQTLVQPTLPAKKEMENAHC